MAKEILGEFTGLLDVTMRQARIPTSPYATDVKARLANLQRNITSVLDHRTYVGSRDLLCARYNHLCAMHMEIMQMNHAAVCLLKMMQQSS